MTVVRLTVNGETCERSLQARTSLADMLRDDLRLTGTHVGCEHGVCGACTVLLEGAPARSCVTLAAACRDQVVTTIEGFGTDELMQELREAFRTEHGLQCGFCTPGMLIAARDIVLRLPDADEARIRRELAGNLCRCTGYIGIVNAIQKVLLGREGKAAVRVQESIPFGPDIDAVVSAAVAEPPAAPPGAHQAGVRRGGATVFEESFVLHDSSERVWELLQDFPLIASALPGAQLLEQSGSQIKGRMTVRMGPMTTAFVGSAIVELDPARREGRIRGGGSDGPAGSRTRAVATYAVRPVDDRTAKVDLSVEYSLQGPLAQFSRTGLAQAFARQLIRAFAANLNARLHAQDASDARHVVPLEGGNFALAALKAWLRQLFAGGSGGKPPGGET
jgi:aerobic carbon-monoxide dehydrogenase small subunit